MTASKADVRYDLDLDTRSAHSLLMAVSQWSSDDDARSVLGVVAFASDAVWATDSYRLVRMPYERLGAVAPETVFPWLVSADRLRWALGRYRSTDRAALSFGDHGVEVSRKDVTVRLGYTEGKYPDVAALWDKYRTGSTSPAPAALNARNLAGLDGLMARNISPVVIPNGLKPAWVVDTDYDEPVALIMPMSIGAHSLLNAAEVEDGEVAA